MIKIRRPLCAAGVVYVAVIIVMLFTTPCAAPVYEALDKEQVTVAGYVDGREYRMSREEKVPVVTLSEAVILKESQISVLEQFLSDSEKIPQHKMQRIWKENKAKLSKEGTAGGEGVLCYMKETGLPEIGSLVIVRGSYRAFTHATNPGEFDSADYYQIMGQQGRIMECRLLSKSRTCDGFRECMYRVREYCSLLLDACYEPEKASVMKAMLLGEKGTLDADIKALYQQNGIIHILAISGLHLSVIGMGCHTILKKIRLPNLVNIILSTGLMYCYGTMTGMGVSMLRAFIMFALHLLAGLIGRTYDLLTAVTVAALVILAGQPLYLQHSGFLFSFGAICGIGQCLGRGTIMSIIIVMFVLPQILLLGEKVIDRTSFAVSIPLKLEKGSGLMRVDGLVQGQVNGSVMGEFHGYIRGDASLFVNMGQMEPREDDGSDLAALMRRDKEVGNEA